MLSKSKAIGLSRLFKEIVFGFLEAIDVGSLKRQFLKQNYYNICSSPRKNDYVEIGSQGAM